MSDFSKEDYLAGMDEVDKMAGNTGPQPASDSAQGSDSDRASVPATSEGPASSEGSADASAAQPEGESQDQQAPAETDSSAEAEAAVDQELNRDGSLTPLGQAKKEAADYLEALQRERADFVNFRNRAQKEQDRFRQHGIIDVLTALLPALDDIDRIRTHGQLDDSFAAVATKIDKTFEKFGVEKYGAAGEDFDPTKYDAVLRKPDASVDHEVIDTLVEAGYRIGDRVIRAARVVVAVPAQE
ncbi:heat shock protein GrpE [Parascardovia denticolens IPLA 20019]|uniref:nucleotide exchange factor GrpE n=1 Tax=Parascardovia denticolens TaxID=78258 RepID=UPI000266AEDD|nr:nucleotide exchange factor GrpE [Parascardovia denticolens]EIT88506.1 heat shock protein GrpE [Parascardovia denticolens IPLA 20019]